MNNIFLSLLFAIFFLSGCSFTSLSVSKDVLNKPQKVAVISLLGDNILFKHVGTTVLTNSEKTFLIKDWQVDAFAEDSMKTALKRNAQLVIVEPQYEKDKMEVLYEKKKQRSPPKFDMKDIEEELRKIQNASGAQMAVLLLREDIQIPGTHQTVRGCSLVARSLLGITGGTSLALGAFMIVADLNTLNPLAVRGVYFREGIDHSYWKEDLKDFSSAQLSFMEKTLKEAMSKKLATTLRRLNLVQE